jgi:hypothetical protein
MALGRRGVRLEIGTFLRQYDRTSRRKGMDPNDRHYSRKVEQAVKRMPPGELDRAIRGDEDEADDD